MRIICLDLETFFDSKNGYTLKKMSTEEYCRDSRFKTHLFGFWDPQSMAGPVEAAGVLLETNEALRETLRTSAVMCFHAHFDLLVLSHWYGIEPAFIFDPLPMARLVLPQLRSHSLDALAAHFNLPAKTVPYHLFDGVLDLDTVPAARAQVASGCLHDVRLMWAIFHKLLPLIPPDELKVIDSTIRMFTEPCLRLDRPRMEKFLLAERVRKAKAMLHAGAAIGLTIQNCTTFDEMRALLARIETKLQSADKFRLALESLGYPCPMKWGVKQECEIPALAKKDAGMKALGEHHDPRVVILANARLDVKSTTDETRAETLLAADSRGALPVYLSYAAAKTLRFGGGDKTNWQNFRRGGEIRQSILAPTGRTVSSLPTMQNTPIRAVEGSTIREAVSEEYKLVIGDLSQIEYRLILWVTGQLDKLEKLAAGFDLYCEFASQFYGEEITKEDKPRRGVGKQGILMGGYGAGRGTMISTAAGGGYGPPVFLSDAEGQRMVDLYRQGHPHVVAFWRWCDQALRVLASGGETSYRDGLLRIANHKIHFPNGTALDYTGLRWATNDEVYPDQKPEGEGYSWWQPTRKGYSRIWGSKLTADIIQALACAVIKDVWVRMLKHGYRPALQVHDELVYAIQAALAEAVKALLLNEMTTPPVWCADISLAAEIEISENYSK